MLCEASRAGHRGVMGTHWGRSQVGLETRGTGGFCWATAAPSIECLALDPHRIGSNYCCCACIQLPHLVCGVPRHLCFPLCTQPLISLSVALLLFLLSELATCVQACDFHAPGLQLVAEFPMHASGAGVRLSSSFIHL
jgi:hypothetical protein